MIRAAGENIGTYAIGQGTVANSNYTITYTGADLTITPKAVTVIADAKNKVYGDADPALTYVATGLEGTDVLSGSLIEQPVKTSAPMPSARVPSPTATIPLPIPVPI